MCPLLSCNVLDTLVEGGEREDILVLALGVCVFDAKKTESFPLVRADGGQTDEGESCIVLAAL